MREMDVEAVEGRAEIVRFDRMLHDEHWLGAGHPAGQYVRQVVIRDGQWVGLLAWGPAARRLKERDRAIGWDAAKRAERLKLVVQNRRFLVPGAAREPNLASQALGAGVRALPEMWRARFQYAPLLAETFTDPEAHAGTCYRAADALARIDSPERVLPLRAAEVASLLEALNQTVDPRHRWCPFRSGTVLLIVVMARMCGRNSIAAIERYGQGLHQKHRRMLELPRDPVTGFYRVPDYMVYYKVLRAIDLDALAATLTVWFRQRAGVLPACLAMDGKMIRDIIGTLTIADASSGIAIATAVQRVKEGGGELKTAQHTLQAMGDLHGSVVTGDPLHAQKQTARQIVEQNGEYVLQVKGNQPALHQCAQSRRDRTPFLPSSNLSVDVSKSARSASSPCCRARPACPTARRS